MRGQAVQIIAVLAALGFWGGTGFAQVAAEPDEDLRRVFERLEQQDRQALQDGFVLDRFEVRQPENDPRRKSMQLSIGRVDGKQGAAAFEGRPSNYLLDPLAEPGAPPLGLNLRLQF